MKGLILIGSGLLAAALAFVLNWLALIPWRRSKDSHWSERARVFYPVRVAATNNLWMVPGVLTSAAALLWSDRSPDWMLLALVTSFAVVVGTIPMEREVFPRISTSELLRQVMVNWVIRILQWFVFLCAITFNSDHFGFQAVSIFTLVLLLCILWNHSGWILVGRRLGLFLPPPQRLVNIVQETAGRNNVQVGDVFVLNTSTAGAYAMPISRKLLFSQRLLELLSDDELEAVTAHELAHLTEARSDFYKRYVIWLMFLPWVLFKPFIHSFGPMGFFILLACSAAAPIFFRSVSRKLESRADQMANVNEPAPGMYANALLKLYEDQLAPAVSPKQRATHPDLYDRLLAAGMQPDFPRPRPALAMAWTGHVFSAALGLLGMLLVIKMTAG